MVKSMMPFLVWVVLLFPTVAVAQVCAPAPANLVSWWPGNGNANDAAGFNHGNLQGGASFASGHVSQGFSFNGVDGIVRIPDSATLDVTNQLTIDAWVFPTDVNGIRTIVAKDSEQAGQRSFALNLGYPNAQRAYWFVAKPGGSYSLISCSSPLQVNTWQHLAATYQFVSDGTSRLKLYLNGAVCAEDSTGVGPINVSATDVGIGRYATYSFGSLAPWKGLIDEVDLFDRALSEQEIQTIYNAGSQGKCDVTIPTTTVLTVSPNASAYGRVVQLAARVAAANGTNPAGTVDFYDGVVRLGTGSLAGTNPATATLLASSFAPGGHTLRAV